MPVIRKDITRRWQPKDQAESYDRQRFHRPLGRLYHRLHCRALRRCLKRLASDAMVADIPCGTGRLLPVLAEHAAIVVACDISPAMVAQARRRLNGTGAVHFVFADASACPIQDHSVAAVTSVRFFMHLNPAERTAVLQEFARISQRWVIVEYGCYSAWHKVRRFVRRLYMKVAGRSPSYTNSVTRQQILDEARAAGLEVHSWQWTLRGLSESVFVIMQEPSADRSQAITLNTRGEPRW